MTLVIVVALFVLAVAVVAMMTGCRQREGLRFNRYSDPIYPDGGQYVSQYWPRTAGQLGEHVFSGHPQYATAY